MKPWEETWENDVVEIAAHVAYDDDRRRLASAAPDLVRVLMALRDRRVVGLHVCCGVAVDPSDNAHPIDDHSPTCPVEAALRKAGVR